MALSRGLSILRCCKSWTHALCRYKWLILGLRKHNDPRAQVIIQYTLYISSDTFPMFGIKSRVLLDLWRGPVIMIVWCEVVRIAALSPSFSYLNVSIKPIMFNIILSLSHAHSNTARSLVFAISNHFVINHSKSHLVWGRHNSVTNDPLSLDVRQCQFLVFLMSFQSLEHDKSTIVCYWMFCFMSRVMNTNSADLLILRIRMACSHNPSKQFIYSRCAITAMQSVT